MEYLAFTSLKISISKFVLTGQMPLRLEYFPFGHASFPGSFLLHSGVPAFNQWLPKLLSGLPSLEFSVAAFWEKFDELFPKLHTNPQTSQCNLHVSAVYVGPASQCHI